MKILTFTGVAAIFNSGMEANVALKVEKEIVINSDNR